jgi:hypothetical protein
VVICVPHQLRPMLLAAAHGDVVAGAGAPSAASSYCCLTRQWCCASVALPHGLLTACWAADRRAGDWCLGPPDCCWQVAYHLVGPPVPARLPCRKTCGLDP